MSDTTPKDGGPAFPVLPPDAECYQNWPAFAGMSLRDYFAAKALPAVIDVESTADLGHGRCMFSEAAVAKQAYAIADAMLKAREK